MEQLLLFAEELGKVSSLSELYAWFMWLPLYMRIVVGACAFGCLAVIYIFTVAIFVDNHQ